MIDSIKKKQVCALPHQKKSIPLFVPPKTDNHKNQQNQRRHPYGRKFGDNREIAPAALSLALGLRLGLIRLPWVRLHDFEWRFWLEKGRGETTNLRRPYLGN